AEADKLRDELARHREAFDPLLGTGTEGAPLKLGTVSEKVAAGKPQLGTVTETIPGKPRRVQMREQRAQKGVKAVPRLAGAEECGGGKVYVPYYSTEGGGARVPAAVIPSPGGVVGRLRSLTPRSRQFTGQSLLSGKVPENTTGLVARQALRAVRY